MIATSEFSMGLPTIPPKVMGRTRAENLQEHRKYFALINDGSTTIQEVRDRYHPAKYHCPRHGLAHTAHPLSVLCLHPRCLAAWLAKSARRQGLLHRLLQLKDHHHLDDFIQYVAYRMVVSARNDPLGATQPNVKFLLNHFHRNFKTNYGTSSIDKQVTELATDERTIKELVEAEADEMVNNSDNATTIAAIRQARERFGNDTQFLALAGELTPFQVARLEAAQEDQIDYSLAMPDIQVVQRIWWRAQFNSMEARHGTP